MQRLLIANRGEIAVRIARTARRLGIATVAVHSDPDAGSMAALAADEAVRLPGQTSAETYLRGDLILAAAQRTGADAVHPGYGFLSENPGFARAVGEAGLTWVGPTPEQIEAMALKVEAKHLAAKAGVPLVPGAELDAAASDAQIATAGGSVGYPLLVKASAGGGGKGMRLVAEPADLLESVASARREAASAFGDPTVFLERYLRRARHVEVQVFGDAHGNVVHLFERECSIQRRHQKVVEEAPSPGATEDTRQAMYAAATSLAREIGYVGAGTVEFMVAGAGAAQEFFFLEMNTRLQVEHPVTEAITGLDLVEWQLRVARGEPLPLGQDQIRRTGHAVEVRLYAEDPAAGYLPNTGRLARCEFRPAEHVRVDTGVGTGSEVTALYDPMLAKIIAWAQERGAAAERLAGYLDALPVIGLSTNRASLAAVLREPDFLAGATTTDYLEEHPQVLDPPVPAADLRRAMLAAVLAARAPGRPALVAPGWRNVPAVPQFARVAAPQERTLRWWPRRAGSLQVEVLSGGPFTGDVVDAFEARAEVGDGTVRLEVDGVSATHEVLLEAGQALVLVRGRRLPVAVLPRFEEAQLGGGAAGPSTPVPGTVTIVAVEPGQEVAAGQTLVVLEAMKMEHRITADADGVVAEVLVVPGQSVDAHQVVVVLEEAP
jgi:acetyl/propionyl-CoA carboxylase alpha subunit